MIIVVAALLTAAFITFIVAVGRMFGSQGCAPVAVLRTPCAAATVEQFLGRDDNHERHIESDYIHVASSNIGVVTTVATSAFFDFAPVHLVRLRGINPAVAEMIHNQGSELSPGFQFSPNLPE